MDGWMDGWMERWKHGWKHGWMFARIYRAFCRVSEHSLHGRARSALPHSLHAHASAAVRLLFSTEQYPHGTLQAFATNLLPSKAESPHKLAVSE